MEFTWQKLLTGILPWVWSTAALSLHHPCDFLLNKPSSIVTEIMGAYLVEWFISEACCFGLSNLAAFSSVLVSFDCPESQERIFNPTIYIYIYIYIYCNCVFIPCMSDKFNEGFSVNSYETYENSNLENQRTYTRKVGASCPWKKPKDAAHIYSPHLNLNKYYPHPLAISGRKPVT